MSIDKAFVNMLVTDMQPAKIIEDEEFRKFIKVLDLDTTLLVILI